jgi:hypothetical protein
MPMPRPAAQSFRDLVVWQKAQQFVLAVYRFTESFPDREKFRAVPSDAPGCGFHTRQHC